MFTWLFLSQIWENSPKIWSIQAYHMLKQRQSVIIKQRQYVIYMTIVEYYIWDTPGNGSTVVIWIEALLLMFCHCPLGFYLALYGSHMIWQGFGFKQFRLYYHVGNRGHKIRSYVGLKLITRWSHLVQPGNLHHRIYLKKWIPTL